MKVALLEMIIGVKYAGPIINTRTDESSTSMNSYRLLFNKKQYKKGTRGLGN